MKRRGIKSTCAKCGRVFSSLAAFDRHRIGKFQGCNHDRHCMEDTEVEKYFEVNSKGFYRLRA